MWHSLKGPNMVLARWIHTHWSSPIFSSSPDDSLLFCVSVVCWNVPRLFVRQMLHIGKDYFRLKRRNICHLYQSDRGKSTQNLASVLRWNDQGLKYLFFLQDWSKCSCDLSLAMIFAREMSGLPLASSISISALVCLSAC